ncbi:MAG: Wzz/FepE/Etk N-terminal domain-containing protein [Gudongella sp.]|nr:Wzz/FepE/Etk N-terminal domain-containing protein [Gudongella sp.]
MEDKQFEDEISLKELITILLNGWKTIVAITLVLVLLGGVYAWFIASPSFESKLRGIIDIPETIETKYGTYTFTTTNHMDYLSLIKSDRVLASTITDLGLETTIQSLADRISINNDEESNVFVFTVTADSPQKASDLISTLREYFLIEVNYMNEGKALNYFINLFSAELDNFKEQELYITGNITKTEELLAELEPTILLRKYVLTDPLYASVLAKDKNVSLEDLKDETMLVEEINPNYTELENEVVKLKQELKDLELGNARSKLYYEELKNESANLIAVKQGNNDNPLTLGLQDVLSTTILLNQTPSLPINPVAPRKMLILAISLVLGLMIGVFTAFFKAYWNESK